MNIEIVKVPQYMSKNVNVIMVDGKPFCTCRGKETTSKVIARLQGYKMDLSDKRIERMADKNFENELVKVVRSKFGLDYED